MSTVKVCVRLRPLNKREKSGSSDHIPVITTDMNENSVTIVKGLGSKAVQHRFHVDSVFGSFAEQQEIFDNSVRPIISEVLDGFEATVFAYGQTGTGKTYTMEGDIASEEHMGIIPRSCKTFFEKLAEPQYVSSRVSCSYLEIYNEELSDLLINKESDTVETLKICTTSKGKGGRVVCMGLKTRTVGSADEVIEVLNEARERRQIGETKMNKHSSRSHCLFTLQIESTEEVDGGRIQRTGKLHLVDLAGSECAKSTGAQSGSTRLKESKNINKSLLTLGRVIATLRSGSGRVPYRDSKLTRLLQEALGGRCKTLIVATLSPSILSLEESLSTMSYAEQAHGIVNKPIEARARMSMYGAGKSGHMSSGGGQAGEVSTQTFVEMEQKLRYYQSQVSRLSYVSSNLNFFFSFSFIFFRFRFLSLSFSFSFSFLIPSSTADVQLLFLLFSSFFFFSLLFSPFFLSLLLPRFFSLRPSSLSFPPSPFPTNLLQHSAPRHRVLLQKNISP